MSKRKNADYWKKRFRLLEDAQHKQSQRQVYESVKKPFSVAMQEINKELSLWYARYAKENQISIADAKKMLTFQEQKELRWSLEQYEKNCKRYAAMYHNKHKDERLLQQLKNVTARYNVNRLQALNMQIQVKLEDLYANQADSLDQYLLQDYSQMFYRTAFEVQKGTSVGVAVNQMDENRAQKVIAKPWTTDGKTFSDRLWKNKQNLVQTLHQELPQAFIQGKPLSEIVKTVSQRMNAATSSAARLVMTESAFFATAGQKDSFSFLGVKQYEFVATLDDRTSEICQDMDGKVFDLKDMKPGVNAPPMHCYCRSTTVPYFDDAKDKGRAARDKKTGKTTFVPADMRYDDWQIVYVNEAASYDEWKQGKENFAHHDLKNGIIEVKHTKLQEHPYAVTMKTSAKGGKEYNFYNAQGNQYLQIADNDHGHSAESVIGKHGEHAHWCDLQHKPPIYHGQACEVPSYAREALGDKL